MLDQRPDKGHLLTSVVEDDLGVRGGAAEAVGSHDHGEVARVHLCHGSHFRLGENLQPKNKTRRVRRMR